MMHWLLVHRNKKQIRQRTSRSRAAQIVEGQYVLSPNEFVPLKIEYRALKSFDRNTQ